MICRPFNSPASQVSSPKSAGLPRISSHILNAATRNLAAVMGFDLPATFEYDEYVRALVTVAKIGRVAARPNLLATGTIILTRNKR